MLKARSGNVILFGLEEENLKRLREGKPIKIEGAEIGMDKGIVIGIFYGENHAELLKQLEELTGIEVWKIRE